MVALTLGTLVVLAVVASVTLLTARGLDPDPMLRLAAEVAGSLALVANLLVTLTGRAGQAKVERVAGRELPARLDDIEAKVDAALYLDAEAAEVAQEDLTGRMPPATRAGLPPVPEKGTQPHPLMGAAPVPPRRIGQDSLDAEARQGPPERRGVR
jgi:hypothetical protein